MSVPTPSPSSPLTAVINSKDAPKGWRDDPRFVHVGRMRNGKIARIPGHTGYFGNLFKIGDEYLDTGRKLTREDAVQFFRSWAEHRIATDPDYKAAVRGLHGKTLVCYCKPEACHGDVLAELAERLNSEVTP